MHNESATPPATARLPVRRAGARRWGDPLFRGGAICFAGLIVAVFAAIGIVMYHLAQPALAKFGWSFIWSTDWDPVRDQFGGLPFIFGTAVSSLLALVLAVPVSVGIAIFLSEFAPSWLRAPVAFLVDLLAAIPSVVYGLWGVFMLVPWIRTQVQPLLGDNLDFLPLFTGPRMGIGMLAAGMVLAIMIIPSISAISREVLQAIPNSLREGALALGATPWEMTWRVIVPAARPGILGGVILGLGRALGETMAVTMVIGNRPEIKASLFAPAATMASVLANEFAEATSEMHVAALIEIGLLLFAVTLLLNIGARVLVWSVARRA